MKPRGRASDARRTVGRYRLERPLGTGASATVYLARLEGEAGFARDVALKLVHAPLPFDEGHPEGSEADVGQPLVEARIASRIRHPNVVPVLDMGRDEDDRVFLVMEYVEGASLNALLRRTAEQGELIPLGVALAILDDLLAGLHAAHEARGDDGAPLELVHRDVSPHNVIVGIDGVSRLTDFGIAKVTDATMQTAAGIVKGKPGYMAPEQLRGTGIDRRTDLWAAGVIAWELLAGRRLYKSKDLMSLSLEIVTTTPPSLRAHRKDLPLGLDRAVARALARDSRDRWETAETFRAALAEAGGPPARREIVAAVVRGDKPEEARASRPSATPNPPVTVLGEITTTVPLSSVPSPTLRTSAPPPEGAVATPGDVASAHATSGYASFDGSTQATASVSTLAAVGAQKGVPWRGLALAAVVLGAGATLVFAGTADRDPALPGAASAAVPDAAADAAPEVDTPSSPTAEATVTAAPAIDVAPAGGASADAPDGAASADAPEASPEASAPAAKVPPPRVPARPKTRPPPRPPPPATGKLMDSPYR